MRVLFALVLAILVAGCLQGAVPEAAPLRRDDAAPAYWVPYLDERVAYLRGLNLSTVPDAARVVDELEAFTAAMPLRHSNLPTHVGSRDYLERSLRAAGLDTYRHSAGLLPETRYENVIGVLRGTDPDPHAAIIFGAHFDGARTGIGAAYDNGSGTLVVLELARALAKYQWRQNLLFAFWDDEEDGKVGSAGWVRDIGIPNHDVTLYLNFDMVGLNWPVGYYGTPVPAPLYASYDGFQHHTFADMQLAAHAYLDHPDEATRQVRGSTLGNSDHDSFVQAGMPVVTFIGLSNDYAFWHNADTFETMLAVAGGDRDTLVQGFDTVLQTAFLMTFLIDHEN